MKTTNQHKKFWKNRKIDWDKSYFNGIDEVSGKPMWNHPHRNLLILALKSINFLSLWEIGCGAGANLMKIVKELPGKQLGGSDINPDAIEFCKKTFVGGNFHVESVEDMLMSDKATDVMLSDATLIYIGPREIHKALKEMTRITRKALVLCEFHEKHWWKRWWLRLTTGYNSYNYIKELEKVGCYNILLFKIPKEYWQGFPWERYGYIIKADI